MKLRPEDDGVTHINVYSKGRTDLGRWLSNFQEAPFVIYDDGKFASIEGYWYWLATGGTFDILRDLSGHRAKETGKLLLKGRGVKKEVSEETFKNKILYALTVKLCTYPEEWSNLSVQTLPLTHYYVYSGRAVATTKHQWVIDHLEKLREAGRLVF